MSGKHKKSPNKDIKNFCNMKGELSSRYLLQNTAMINVNYLP